MFINPIFNHSKYKKIIYVDTIKLRPPQYKFREYIDNKENRDTLEDIIDANSSLKGNDRAKKEIGETYAEIFNRKPLYDKVGRWKNA